MMGGAVSPDGTYPNMSVGNDGTGRNIADQFAEIRQDIENESHFRGVFTTVDELKSAYPTATPNDYAYITGGNIWVYQNNEWVDSEQPVPNSLVPASNSIPLMDGEGSAGTSNNYARGDHKHPSDTTKANTNGTYPNMTVGNANNATNDGNGNKIADTYVKLSDLKRAWLDEEYPINGGRLYTQYPDEPTPAEKYAGTGWTEDTTMSGRVLVGSGILGSNRYSIGGKGGRPDTVLPRHNHYSFVNDETSGSSHLLYYGDAAQGNTNQLKKILGAAYGSGSITESGDIFTSYEGAKNFLDTNLPPYIVVTYWKRTA